MRTVRRTLALLLPLLSSWTVLAGHARAQREPGQWHFTGVRPCARADSLFGRLWRSHQGVLHVSYSRQTDTTIVMTPHRNLSWEPTSSRLVATEATVWLPGHGLTTDSARIQLRLGFVDTLYRSVDQAHVSMVVDDSVHMEFDQPQVDYPMDVKTTGVAEVVTVLLTPAQTKALARANRITGTMGGFAFQLRAFELWELNELYRASICGLE